MGRISTAASTVYVVSKISEAILDHQKLQTNCFVPVDVCLWVLLHFPVSLMNGLNKPSLLLYVPCISEGSLSSDYLDQCLLYPW